MLDFFAITAAGLLVILIYLWVTRLFKKTSGVTSTENYIPRWTTPPADKELGDFGELAKHGSVHKFLLHIHDNGKVPITSFWWGKTHVVSLCSPQAFKETVKLVNRPVELFVPFEPLLGKGSITYANDEEFARRLKCLYHTLKGDELKEYFPIFVKIAQEAEAHWSSFSSDQHVPIMKEVFPMTIKGIVRTCLGDVFENDGQLDELATAYHKCWREMEEWMIGDPPDAKREAEFQKNKEVFEGVVRRIIRNRKEGAGQREIPFIDALLQNYDSEEKIVGDIVTFMVAGFHTSGYLLTWMLWYLAENTSSQDRLRAEIDSEVKGQCGERLKKYAERNDTFLCKVMDFCRWDPDRFPADGRRGLEFCPFGVPNRRKCPGYLFSYFEVGVFTSILLSRFKVEPVEGQNVTQMFGLITEPKEEIFVYIRERE